MSTSQARTWILNNYHRFTDQDTMRQECAQETGLSRDAVNKAHRRLTDKGRALITGASAVSRPRRSKESSNHGTEGIIDLDDFLDDIDIAGQIEEYLDHVLGDNVMQQKQLMGNIECTEKQFRAAIRDPRFEGRHITMPDRRNPNARITIWSSESSIAKIQATLRAGRI